MTRSHIRRSLSRWSCHMSPLAGFCSSCNTNSLPPAAAENQHHSFIPRTRAVLLFQPFKSLHEQHSPANRAPPSLLPQRPWQQLQLWGFHEHTSCRLPAHGTGLGGASSQRFTLSISALANSFTKQDFVVSLYPWATETGEGPSCSSEPCPCSSLTSECPAPWSLWRGAAHPWRWPVWCTAGGRCPNLPPTWRGQRFPDSRRGSQGGGSSHLSSWQLWAPLSRGWHPGDLQEQLHSQNPEPWNAQTLTILQPLLH